jgi:hypothetical protein
MRLSDYHPPGVEVVSLGHGATVTIRGLTVGEWEGLQAVVASDSRTDAAVVRAGLAGVAAVDGVEGDSGPLDVAGLVDALCSAQSPELAAVASHLVDRIVARSQMGPGEGN